MNEQTSVTESVDSVAAARSAKAILVLVCIALFFAVLEASAVSVILPEIATGVSADTAQIGWLMTGFLQYHRRQVSFSIASLYALFGRCSVMMPTKLPM